MGQPNPPADPGATPPAPTTEPAKTEPATGDGLGDAGKKALDALRAEIKDLQKQNRALQDRDPVKAIAEALGVKPSSEPDALSKLAAEVKELREGRAADGLRAVRLEVAAEKGLTPAQAKRLQGSTREELEADADDLLATFPAAPASSGTPGTPAPDPSQGSRGTGGTPPKLTVADIKRLAAEGKNAEIEKARVEGRIDYESARKR